MKVLIITGDKKFASSGRFRLQATQVDRLEAMYWGRGGLFPRLAQEKFSVVTVQDPFWRGLFALHVAHKLRTTLNVQVHADFAAQSFVKRVVGRFVLRRASSVRVVSEKIKKQVEAMGVNAPIHVLPIFVDISHFKNLVRQPHEQKTILWIGRFEDEKDPLCALTILKEVRQKGIEAKLVMLGSGSLEQDLHEAAEGTAVEFPGWSDPKPYLQMADVVLCTSKHESYGASIIEALAAGVPVVAPDVGVAREAGAIVVPREAFAGAIVEVLNLNSRGALKVPVLAKEEWAHAWKETL